MFGDFDAVKIATRKLLDLKQTGSALTYSTEFQRYAVKTGWDTVALMVIYERGLKLHLREELARTGAAFPNILEMIEAVSQLDSRLHEFRRGQGQGKQHQERRRTDGGYHGKNQRYQDRERSQQQVNATQRKELSKEEKKRRRENKLCYECGKPGHLASTHRNQGHRQIAVLERVPIELREDQPCPIYQEFREETPSLAYIGTDQPERQVEEL